MNAQRLAIGLLTLSAVGCSSPPDPAVRCVVTIDGQPRPLATVTLHPEAEGVMSATGQTGPDGGCELVTLNEPSGVLPGAYRVTVEDPDDARRPHALDRDLVPRNRPIPAPYTSPARTPLRVTIPADQLPIRLDLRGDAR